MPKFSIQDGAVILPIYQQIELDPGFTEEHELKKQSLLDNMQLKSPYLKPEDSLKYLVSINENDKFIDCMENVLEDGTYLISMTGDYQDGALVNVLIYASADDLEVEELISLPATLPPINHPNFIQGRAVLFSGFMKINAGLIQTLNNNSGHSKSRLPQILPAIHYIASETHAKGLKFTDASTECEYYFNSGMDYKNYTLIIKEPEVINKEPEVPPSNNISHLPETSRFDSNPLARKNLFFDLEKVTGQTAAENISRQKT